MFLGRMADVTDREAVHVRRRPGVSNAVATTDAQIAHVHRRLGFGPTIDDIDAGRAAGVAATIEDLRTRPLTGPADWALPLPSGPWEWDEMILMANKILSNYAHTSNPLQERLAWILNGLVVVSLHGNVDYHNMHGYEELLRTHALG